MTVSRRLRSRARPVRPATAARRPGSLGETTGDVVPRRLPRPLCRHVHFVVTSIIDRVNTVAGGSDSRSWADMNKGID